MVHQYNYCIANNLYICCTYTRTWISRFKVRWFSPVKQRSAYTVYFRHNDLLLIYHVVNYFKLLEVQQSRHINIRHFWLKEKVGQKEVIIEHLRTDEMFANILTKPVQGAQFDRERNGLTKWYL